MTKDSHGIRPPEAPCLLVLGENATGKSSILEAITLAGMSPRLREQLRKEPLKLTPGKLTLNPEFLGAEDTAPREVATITLEFHGGNGTSSKIRTVEIRKSEDDDGGVFKQSPQANGEQYPLIFAYGANRLFGRERRILPTRHVDTLFDSTLHLSNPEAWLVRRKKDELDAVAAALRHIIQIDGEFSTIEIADDPSTGKPCAWINLKRPRRPGERTDKSFRTVRQRLSYVSSGYQSVIALLCDIFERLLRETGVTVFRARQVRAIILIDEIEAHLHPRWKLQIIDGLRRVFPCATFIMTSHDPLCVRGMRSGEVMMLNRHVREDHDIPETVERIDDFGFYERMTVEQLLTSDMFQLVNVDDPRAEQHYATVSELLTRQQALDEGSPDPQNPAPLTPDEQSMLESFRSEVARGMPTGVSEVTNVVQRAVAEYLSIPRSDGTGRRRKAREKAEQQILEFLENILA